jgi:hypothetical protein
MAAGELVVELAGARARGSAEPHEFPVSFNEPRSASDGLSISHANSAARGARGCWTGSGSLT